jgi:predicted RNA-binding protein YlqC (UPF0109 family)
MEIEFGDHVLLRMAQRGVTREEVRKVVDEPDDLQVAADEHSNNHYVRRFIRETPGQLSREALITVVVDPYKRPNKVVTVTVD